MNDINNSFEKDLNRGKEIELKVLSIIQKTCPSATLIDAYKGYDIWIPETHKSIEVKYDPMSNVTGNLVVEIEMFNKTAYEQVKTERREIKRTNKRHASAEEVIFIFEKILAGWKTIRIFNTIIQQNPDSQINK